MLKNFDKRFMVACLLIGLIIGHVAAATNNSLFLPTIMRAQSTTPFVILRTTDTTFIDATQDTLTRRIYVTFIDRGNGNRAHLTELVGDALVETGVPNVSTGQQYEGFVSPDAAKEADVCVIYVDGYLYWFVTARPLFDPTGPFQLTLRRIKL